MRAAISYDLVMDDNMSFVEGSYRLPGGNWQVVIVSRKDVVAPEVVATSWMSGVTGVFVRFPYDLPLNSGAAEQVLSAAFGVTEWMRVRGPDSMQLR